MKTILQAMFASVCEGYKDALNKMWDTDGEWISDDYQTFEVADCYIGNKELRYLVDNEIDWDTFYAWYNYDLTMHYGMELGKEEAVVINLDHWCKGFPEELKVPKETYEKWEREYWEKTLKYASEN